MPSKQELMIKMADLLFVINDGEWFPNGTDSCYFRFPDDSVRIGVNQVEIEDSDVFLEKYDELNTYVMKEYNGVSFSDNETSSKILQQEGGMYEFKFSFGLSDVINKTKDPLGPGEWTAEVNIDYLQFGGGEIAGYKVVISGDIELNSLEKWISKVIDLGEKVEFME